MGRRTIGLAQIIARARQLRATGMTYRAISAALGISHHVAVYWCNDADRERQRSNARERSRRIRRAKWERGSPVWLSLRVPIRQPFEVAWNEDRTLTAVLMGDPPPGRSALAQRTST